MNHIFNKEIAEEYGFAAAVILHHLHFWVCQNKEAGRNELEGRTWTYATGKELCSIFSYLTSYQIRDGIKKLKDAGLIVTGRYNKLGMDRTIWYSITEKAMDILERESENGENTAILRNQKMHLPESKNAFVENEKCICRNQKIHLSNSQNAFVESERPIPDNNQIDNQMDNTNGKGKTKILSKIAYADYVTMTEKEYLQLVEEYGPEMTEELIKILDAYKGSKGRKYKSDYRAILSWVVDKYYERQNRNRHNKDRPKNRIASLAEEAEKILQGGAENGEDHDTGDKRTLWSI